MDKGTDDMKINFQKWLKWVWVSFFRFIHEAELGDAQMDGLKLKIYLCTRIVSAAKYNKICHSLGQYCPGFDLILLFLRSTIRTVDKYFQENLIIAEV